MARRDRESRGRERNVRVFTVNSESCYVVVRNVPALGVIDDLLKRLSLYGKICEYRILDHDDDLRNDDDDDANAAAYGKSRRDDDRFTDVVWIQYETVNNARHAKVRAVQKPFFGSILHIQYAPQYETREDTMVKLQQRRELLQRRARVPVGAHYSGPRNQQYYVPDTQKMQTPLPQQQPVASSDEFIGPKLPSRDWRPPVEPKAPAQPIDAKPKRRRI